MATNSLVSREQHRGRCHCSCCVGQLGLEDKGKLVEEEDSMDSGETTLAENCFHAKNRASNRQILANMERELQATFRIKDGNGRSLNSVWVVGILLGRLLREQTTLGKQLNNS